ncbi:hypothetical protein BKA93DRAFT_517719 [Sparassis latifolia]
MVLRSCRLQRGGGPGYLSFILLILTLHLSLKLRNALGKCTLLLLNLETPHLDLLAVICCLRGCATGLLPLGLDPRKNAVVGWSLHGGFARTSGIGHDGMKEGEKKSVRVQCCKGV